MIFNLGGGAAAPQLTSIAVTTQPSKTSYDIGDSFNKSGMVVTAYFDDGTSSVVTGYTYSPTAITINTAAITVSYTFDGVTKTTTVAVQPNHTLLSSSGFTNTYSGGFSLGTKFGKYTYAQTEIGSNYIKLTSPGGEDGSGCGITTASENAIDLTAFKTLTVTINDSNDISGASLYFGVASSRTASATSSFAAVKSFTAEGTHSLNISSLSGSYYIILANKSNGKYEWYSCNSIKLG